MKTKSQHHLKVFTSHTSKVKSSEMNKESQILKVVVGRACVVMVVRPSRAFELRVSFSFCLLPLRIVFIRPVSIVDHVNERIVHPTSDQLHKAETRH